VDGRPAVGSSGLAPIKDDRDVRNLDEAGTERTSSAIGSG
jgi:hypothetical protein